MPCCTILKKAGICQASLARAGKASPCTATSVSDKRQLVSQRMSILQQMLGCKMRSMFVLGPILQRRPFYE